MTDSRAAERAEQGDVSPEADWAIEAVPEGVEWFSPPRFVILGALRQTLATVYGQDPQASRVAALVAAAPDLLAACELHVAFEDDAGDDAFGDYLARANAVSDAIRAAVAKARGENP